MMYYLGTLYCVQCIILSTGHGGENFLKFQDSEEISNVELGDAFEQMWQKKRYTIILCLFIVYLCVCVCVCVCECV